MRDQAKTRCLRKPLRAPCLVVLVLVLALVEVQSLAAREVAPGRNGQATRLRIVTPEGPIVAVLYPEAAPRAIEALGRVGSGVGFEWASPHGEVRTGHLAELDGVRAELNGESLGLHEDRIADAGEAMEVMQQEVLGRHGRDKRTQPSARFRTWIEQWKATRRPDFLVGISRLELYEALGYRYDADVVTRPVVRGSVALRASTDATVQPQLVFSLVDRPEQTGRWVVVGHVVEGIDLIRQISVRPLARATEKKGVLADRVPLSRFELEDIGAEAAAVEGLDPEVDVEDAHGEEIEDTSRRVE